MTTIVRNTTSPLSTSPTGEATPLFDAATPLVLRHERALTAEFIRVTGFVQRKDGIVPVVERATLAQRSPGVLALHAEMRLGDKFRGPLAHGLSATVTLHVSEATGDLVKVKPTWREALDIFVKAL